MFRITPLLKKNRQIADSFHQNADICGTKEILKKIAYENRR